MLTARQATILRYRCAGWNADRIARKLNVPVSVVRRDIAHMNRRPIPGLTTGTEDQPAFRLAFALGLLTAGVDPRDVPRHLADLISDEDLRLP